MLGVVLCDTVPRGHKLVLIGHAPDDPVLKFGVPIGRATASIAPVIADGITALEEKSLGAVQKGGQAMVTDVIDYGARVRRPRLTLLEAPGNDAVSSTALSVAGAGLILFTTGRGTPLGFPAPTVKIASNSDLAARKPGWIAFDAGMVLDAGMDAAADALLDRIVAIASGEPTAVERNDEREIAIWKRGVTL